MDLFYGELASYWPLISPVEEYAAEADLVRGILEPRHPRARTLLELGSGGGHLAFHLAGRYACHLTDLSAPMLALSAALNPGCAHTQGDMRSLDLGRTFDVVLAYDSIDYMATEADLAAAIATAWRHLGPGGLACFVPDELADTFTPGTDVSGADAPDGRGARLFEWSFAPAPGETACQVHYIFALRAADGTVQTLAETHTYGLFSRETWERLLRAQGFEVEAVVEETDEDREPRTIFLGRRPAG